MGPIVRPEPPVARRPRGNVIPIPSDHASFIAHVVALVILASETVYWVAQPCIGDIACAPMVGWATGFVLIPLAVGVAIWRLARRASVLVVIDAVLVTYLVPLSASLVASGSVDPAGLFLLPGLSLILLFGVLGPIADLGAHRIERWMVIAITAALAIVMTFLSGMLAIFPGLIALVLALDPPLRTTTSPSSD